MTLTQAFDRKQKKDLAEGIRHSLWHRGYLRHILLPKQKEVYDFFRDTQQPQTVFNCCRQFGKSVLLLTLAFEQCLQQDNQVVLFVAPTNKQASEIVKQKVKDILKHKPRDARIKTTTNPAEIHFPNGSRIIVTGVEVDDGDRARGTSANLVIMDEASYMSNLAELIDYTIAPMTSRTGGRIIISSTPPSTQAHDFPQLVNRARAQKAYIERNIYQSDRTEEEIQREIDRYSIIDAVGNVLTPGTETPSFQVEYMCQMVTDKSRLIIPEWATVRDYCIQEPERPEHYHTYVIADWGFKDKTGILFGYYDFRNSRIIVEDEILVDNMISTEIADLIQDRMAELYPGKDPDEIFYYCDHDYNIMGEIRKKTGIEFRLVNKRVSTSVKEMGAPNNNFRDASVNDLRAQFQQSSVVIHPRCIELIYQLDNGIWELDKHTKERKGFIRSEQLGHCDLLASLIYMNWSVKWQDNPYPPERLSVQRAFIPPGYYEDQDAFASMSRSRAHKNRRRR